MTITEAREIPPQGTYVTDGQKYYAVQHYDNNPHDLWFWPCNRAGRIVRNRRVFRVYLGSANIPTSGLDDLARVTVIVPNAKGWLPTNKH